jgi:EpsI family protein
MSGPRLRAVLVVCAIVATAAMAHLTKPTVFMADTLGKPNLETVFPKQFGTWRIDTSMPMILPSPDTQALLNSIYNQTLTRTYVNDEGSRIMLSVAYGGDQSDGTRAHLPEVCYPAQGFQITSNFTSHLNLAGRDVATRQLMATQGLRNEPITYWLVVGDRVTVSRTDQKLAQFRLGLKGLIPDGMLVRVSSIDPDMAHGYQVQKGFLTDMAATFAEPAKDRVFGVKFN